MDDEQGDVRNIFNASMTSLDPKVDNMLLEQEVKRLNESLGGRIFWLLHLKGLPHDGEFANKSQIKLREKSHCEFAIDVSHETAVLAC